MPDGHNQLGLPVWRKVERPDLGQYLTSREQAADVYDPDVSRYTFIRSQIGALFTIVHSVARLAPPEQMPVLRSVLEGLIDLDSNTVGYELDVQAEAREWMGVR